MDDGKESPVREGARRPAARRPAERRLEARRPEARRSAAARAYGIAFGMSYATALALAMGMVFVFQTAQPALLYIVPCVNMTILCKSLKEVDSVVVAGV